MLTNYFFMIKSCHLSNFKLCTNISVVRRSTTIIQVLKTLMQLVICYGITLNTLACITLCGASIRQDIGVGVTCQVLLHVL